MVPLSAYYKGISVLIIVACLIGLLWIALMGHLIEPSLPDENATWSEWGPCSVTCGGGIQTRTTPDGLADSQTCNIYPCP